MDAESGGIRWVCGFTDEEALARFAQARSTGSDAGAVGRSWEFAELRGARLLDEIIPAMGVPAGIAVNIADPDGSMLFPPVTGIVPEAVAVDAQDAEATVDAQTGTGEGADERRWR